MTQETKRHLNGRADDVRTLNPFPLRDRGFISQACIREENTKEDRLVVMNEANRNLYR